MIGVLTGFKREAGLVPGSCRVVCSGGDPDRAHVLARDLLEQGVEGLFSFGIAGGLVHGLKPGDLVVASGVVTGGESLPCHGPWIDALQAVLPEARVGLVAGAATLAATISAKRLLQLRTHALAVDLESAAVAQACVKAGRPFAVLRAIADPAERGIPEPALAGLDDKGNTRGLAVLWGLLRQPGELPAMVRLALDARAALKALGGATASLGGVFAPVEGVEIIGR